MSNEVTINWETASKKEIFEHKNKFFNASAKIDKVFKSFEPNEYVAIPDYVNAETDSYIAGGVLYSINDSIGFMSNHTTMKGNLDLVWFVDQPMKHGDWTQKQFILSKLKGIEFNCPDEPIQEYSVTPELTEEQEVQIVTGEVPGDQFDDMVKVYHVCYWGIELLVHKIEGEMYFVEELPEDIGEEIPESSDSEESPEL